MTNAEILQRTAEYVEREFQNDSSGHDWWHIYRVWKNALAIAAHEQADVFIVELAALLHDLDDWKLNPGGDEIPVRAQAWMRSLNLDTEIIKHVTEIITQLSFKGAAVAEKIQTIEGMIVQDADRLDAIGAVGIARAFAYGGHKNRMLYDPTAAPQMHASFDEYKKSNSHTINHFYEKLLLLKDRMNTTTAKRIAQQRHAYMVMFLDQFLKEWDGEDFESTNLR